MEVAWAVSRLLFLGKERKKKKQKKEKKGRLPCMAALAIMIMSL